MPKKISTVAKEATILDHEVKCCKKIKVTVASIASLWGSLRVRHLTGNASLEAKGPGKSFSFLVATFFSKFVLCNFVFLMLSRRNRKHKMWFGCLDFPAKELAEGFK